MVRTMYYLTGRLPPARRAVLQALLKAYNDYVFPNIVILSD